MKPQYMEWIDLQVSTQNNDYKFTTTKINTQQQKKPIPSVFFNPLKSYKDKSFFPLCTVHVSKNIIWKYQKLIHLEFKFF